MLLIEHCNNDQDKISLIKFVSSLVQSTPKPPVLPPFTSNGPEKNTKNSKTKQKEVHLEITAHIHS